MKRIISFILVTAIISIVSCGEPAVTNETTTAQTSETTASDTGLSDGITTVDYKGREFNILSRGNFTYEFDSVQTGDVLDDAIYMRNSTVEERFNIKIVTQSYGDANGTSAGNMADVLEHANKSIMAGDDAYQLLSAYIHKAAPGSFNGYYTNWLEMPGIDLDKPWWERAFIDEIELDGKAYIAVGDLSLLFNEVKMAIFFNKQLAEDLSVPDIYKTVSDGKWTIDKLGEYALLATSDLNGDSAMDKNDRYGLGVNKWTHTVPFIYASGTKTALRDDSNQPTKLNESQKLFDVFEKVFSLLNESGSGYVCDDARFAFDEGMFENNQGLFMTSWIGYAGELREMNADFGIIPYPKWDEEQEDYYTTYLDRTSCFLVPVTADLDFTGNITEVMAAESYKQVIPAFYEKALKTKYARDNESQEMLDIITRNTVYDFGFIFSNSIKTSPYMIFRECIYNKDNAFMSKIAAAKDSYAAAIQSLIDNVN